MSTPRGQQPSPYVSGPPAPAAVDLPWGRVLARMLLIVVPGQILGAILCSLVIPFDLLYAHPALGWLNYVFVALVAGLGLGLLLRPAGERLTSYAVLSAVVGAFVLTIFLAVGHARMTSSQARSLLSDVFPGVPLAALLQTAVALALWKRRARRRA